MIGRRAIGLPAFFAFRALAVAAGNAGFASVLAGIVGRILSPRITVAVVASLPSFALTLGVALMVSSLGASFLMPARATLVRDVRGEDDTPVTPQAVLLLIALCGVAVLQLPGIMGWWRAEQAVLKSVLPDRPDPLGFGYIPTVVAYALPVLASLTLVLFALTSLLGIIVPSKLASRVIAACVVLQVGYIAAILFIGAEIHTIGAALGPVIADDPDASRTLADWMAAHDASIGPTSQRLAWTALGYVVAVVVTALSASSWTMTARNGTVVDVPSRGPEIPVPMPHRSIKLDTSSAVDESNYSVHPRMTLLEAWFTRKCTDYEIRTIPRSSRKGFQFSWTDGALRQQAEGYELVRLTPPRTPGLFLDRTYGVVDPRTNQTLARFEPRGADWEISDAAGNLVGRILRETNVHGPVKYRAFVGDAEVVRFKWAMEGFSTTSAQLEVEFLSSTPDAPSLDGVLALAIAPILEQRARIANERGRSG